MAEMIPNQQNQKKRSAANIIFVFVVPAILLLLVANFAFFSISAVSSKMKVISQQPGQTSLAADFKDGETVNLVREKTWLDCRLKMSTSDSIGLSINLKDSLIMLELKGVVLASSKIIEVKSAGFFRKMNLDAYQNLFGTPANVANEQSTIPKEPLTIKKAPKDTIEAEQESAKTEIDTLKREVVHWMLKMDNDITLKIEGVDNASKYDWWLGRKFWFRQELPQLWANFKQTLLFKKPEYSPELWIVIPENEAKAIFRALPVRAQVTIHL